MSTIEPTVRNFGLFSDDVFTSTDLNRRAGEVLNRARETPVTIARNSERFALLRRDQAASLVKGLAQLVEVVQLAQSAGALRENRPDQIAPGAAWIQAFDEEDRQSMLNEIFATCLQASVADDWDSVSTLIQQWRESATVAESGVLLQAMDGESDEQPLPSPRSFPAREN